MSTINGWCGRICIFSLTILLSIFLVDYKTYILPINGIWLALYTVSIIISTVWLSCILIQKLLQQNQVFEYDFENNRYLKFFKISCETLHIPIQTTFFGEISKKGIQTSGSDTPTTDSKEFSKFIDSVPIIPEEENIEVEKNIDERIEIFANDIDERFITKWYKHISKDYTFSFESKVLLEGVIRRVLQVSVQVDSDKIACGALIILLKHLKEYRKSVKRASKNNGSVEKVYRYSHIGNKSETALEHYTHRLTGNVLREFISWELWNSLPSRLLVSILSKRLTTFVINYISQPGWINYKLVSEFASEKVLSQLNLQNYSYISLSDINLSNSNKNDEEKEEIIDKIIEKESSTPKMSPKREVSDTSIASMDKNGANVNKIESVIQADTDSMIEKALTQMIKHQTAPILQRAEKHSSDGQVSDTETPPLSTKQSPEHKKSDDFKPKRSEPVKIHSAQSTTKRWDESDVGTVSIGQDLLALEGMDSTDLHGFSGRRLWGPSIELEGDVDKSSHTLWDINEIFKDKDSLEGEKEEKMSPKFKEKKAKEGKEAKLSPPIVQSIKTSTTHAASIITNTMKPIGSVTATTLHNMRELQQSTVNNVVKPVSNATEKAMHRIGDLQDEAVGVVEGIFDFGMAGIRKGLRLTGLQDNTDVPHKHKTQNSITPHHQEVIKHSPKHVPKLVKTGHIASEDLKGNKSSQESVESVWINPLAKESPNGFENQMLFEKSPNTLENLQETVSVEHPKTTIPDISTDSNAFLTESPEYEETADLASTISKLRSLLQQKSSESSLNTPAASPMPVDEKPCSTPIGEPVLNDATRNDGGMQRFARTVTGMFNTFKGALPGNVNEQTQAKNDQWLYIENEISDTDLPSLLNSLLIERRDYCTVDTAYEAMDSLDLLTESVTSPIKKIQWENQTFEDELDDFDSTIPITKAFMDVLCECLLDTNCSLKQEPVIKAFLVLSGRKLESILSFYADKMVRYLNKSIGPLPKNDNELPIAMELQNMVKILQEAFPNSVKKLFGHEDMRIGLNFFLSSLQSIKINQDIVLQLSELICSQLIYASSQMSPTPSA